ncbi:PEP-CTERM sorting domain-containing protein [Endozoicomonas sp. SM1973]|uniref:PEP-CTERM sorting domain-containing protein n=1 Tax=Spartinivicinus marinus TaxID=2994442 RepID=A0A853I281_9GAMM|nr:PEP-CTERM sorting domain-containing protein [Spartinivicinus marinus]MCX4029918.1 PEP-CTERM sorting domain-containing protein [Spartinivicinus marinus]NYZ64838.1 PEP-CTERM sorting domain-containing protein [Spartinivicinus marinus]
MKTFASVRQLVFICSLMSMVMLLPTKGHSALVSFQVEDTMNPLLLFGMFTVDDMDPNYGTGFQSLIDWAIFDMEGVPGIHTPVDNVTAAMAFINLTNPNLSLLNVNSTDTVIPPAIPSGNNLVLNSDNTWSSGNMNGNYMVSLVSVENLISVHEPSIIALFSLSLTCLFFSTLKRRRR